MEEYRTSLELLGLYDQNLPVFKEARARRLASIDKMLNMIAVLPRLAPKVPKELLYLDPMNPEFEDKMVYPIVEWSKFMHQGLLWGAVTGFFVYNWNTIMANKRLRILKGMYPFISVFMLGNLHYDYSIQQKKVEMFENYTKTRAGILMEQNKYLFDHPHFKRYVYFNEDLKETLASVHRQANNHDASDFKDSELILQDFISRYSDPENPEAALFTENGFIKVFN